MLLERRHEGRMTRLVSHKGPGEAEGLELLSKTRPLHSMGDDDCPSIPSRTTSSAGGGEDAGTCPTWAQSQAEKRQALGSLKAPGSLGPPQPLSPPPPSAHLVPPAEFCPQRCLRCSGRCRSSFQHPLGWRGESAAVRWVGPGHCLLDWVEGNREPVAGTTGPREGQGGSLGYSV